MKQNFQDGDGLVECRVAGSDTTVWLTRRQATALASNGRVTVVRQRCVWPIPTGNRHDGRMPGLMTRTAGR